MNFLAILLLLCQAIPIPPRSVRVTSPPEIVLLERGVNGCHIVWSFTGDADVFRVTRKEPNGVLMQRFLCPHVLNPTFISSTNTHTYSWVDGWPVDVSVHYSFIVTAFTSMEFDLDSAPKYIGP